MSPRGVFARMRGPRLAEILLQSGLVKEDELRRARRAAEDGGSSLLHQLVEAGAVEEASLVRTLGRALRLATVSLRGKKVDPEVLRLVPAELAERYGCLPLFVKEEGGSRALYLGVEDPTDQAIADDVSFRVGLRVVPVVVGPVELRRALGAARTEASVPRAPAAPALPEQPLAVRDTAPELGDVSLAGEEPDEADGTDDGEKAKPRDVPTRDILRAVTRLLLDKEVFSRAELLEAVRAVRDGEGGSSDA